jgi:hypothetical protein
LGALHDLDAKSGGKEKAKEKEYEKIYSVATSWALSRNP